MFDTKGAAHEGDVESDEVICAKHNALIDYITNSPNEAIKGGGVIKAYNGAWRYSPDRISTTDASHWKAFFPDQLVLVKGC